MFVVLFLLWGVMYFLSFYVCVFVFDLGDYVSSFLFLVILFFCFCVVVVDVVLFFCLLLFF